MNILKAAVHMAWIFLLVLCSCMMPMVPAHAETVGCTEITSVPFNIVSPGTYCLNRDLIMRSASAAAITISANNVVLDCNEHEITRYSPSNAAYGVVSTKKRRIEVSNCAFNLFPTGIATVNATTAKIHGNTISRAGLGILVTGEGIEIADNDITGVYGTFAPYAERGILVATGGVGQTRAGVRILENRLARLRSQAIRIEGSQVAVIKGNAVETAGGGIMIDRSNDEPNTPVFGYAVILQNIIISGAGNAVQVEPQQYGMCSGNYISGTADNVVGCSTDSRGNTFMNSL